MENNSYPELSLTTKRSIFWVLILLFVGYSAMVYTTGTEHAKGSELNTVSAQQGKLVFHKYNCISCHQIYGLGGYMGPDLTNVMSAQGKGRPYASAFIKTGTAKMPKFDISEKELENLLDYLEYIGKAANYPVTDFETTWYGNIHAKAGSDE